jgi:ABC-2 type transport system permease protein
MIGALKVGVGNEMSQIIHIVEHDFRNFLRYKMWLVGLIMMNLTDLFITAVVYNKVLNPNLTIKNYFSFFAPGLVVTGLFASAFMIGREVNMERRREVHHYMLCLPMSRLELAVGRVLSGGLRGMIYMSPLLLTCFIFLGLPTVPQFFVILGILFLTAIGIAGLSIAIAVSTSSLEKFVTARGLVYYALFFCSSVFYPLSLIQKLGSEGKFPAVLVSFAEINPLSNTSDTIRSFLLGSPQFSYYSILDIVVFSIVFTFTAAFAYIKIIERR